MEIIEILKHRWHGIDQPFLVHSSGALSFNEIAEQEEVDFDAHNLKDFTFVFDIGITPKVDIKGASSSDEYQDFKIEVADSTIEEELSMIRKKGGETAETESIIEENDIITLDVEELKSEDPVKSEFTVLVKDIPDADLKAKVLKLKKRRFSRIRYLQNR